MLNIQFVKIQLAINRATNVNIQSLIELRLCK